MTTPRRRIIRPEPTHDHRPTDRQLQKIRTRLDSERHALARWMSKLRRAFHGVEKIQQRINRLERQIARKED